MLQRILVPLDGSRLAERTLPYALTCAQATGSRVILIHVMETANGDEREAQPVDPFDWRLRKLEASLYLEEVAELFAEVGAKAEPVLLLGDAAERIVAFARDAEVDLIVMSSHGQSGLSPWNVSSVVQKVLLTTHTSMMIIPAYHGRDVGFGELRYRRIVAPLDGSQRAEYVLPMLQALARLHAPEAQVSLVTVVARPEMLRRAPLSAEDAALVEQVVARNRAEAEKYLAQLQKRIGNQVSTHLLIGDDVLENLYDFVQREEADLVVCSAHGASGSNRRRYGSLVTNFIAYGNTPMLIIQDLPSHKIKKTEAEMVAEERASSAMDVESGRGVRTVVNAPAAA